MKDKSMFQGVAETAAKAGLTQREVVEGVKKRYLVEMLKLNDFNQCRAARAAGMHRNTFSRTADELKLDLRRERNDWQVSIGKKGSAGAGAKLFTSGATRTA